MSIKNGKLILDGVVYESPLDEPYDKRKYKEWKETQKTSFRSIWLDQYIYNNSESVYYASLELKISNRNKVFLDGKELKNEDDVKSVIDVFNNIKFK